MALMRARCGEAFADAAEVDGCALLEPRRAGLGIDLDLRSGSPALDRRRFLVAEELERAVVSRGDEGRKNRRIEPSVGFGPGEDRGHQRLDEPFVHWDP